MQPETEKQATFRAVDLVELLNTRVVAESENETKQICYLIVSHGRYVDDLSNIFKFLK